MIGAEHLVEPFLDDGFAVAACDADDGDVELLAMVCRKGLQGLQGVGYHDEGCFGKCLVGEVFHYEGAQSFVVQFLDVFMAVVTRTFQGKKQSLSGVHQMAAVNE